MKYDFDSENVKEFKTEGTVRRTSDSEHSDARTSEKSHELRNHNFDDLEMPVIRHYEDAADEHRSERNRHSVISVERQHLREEQKQPLEATYSNSVSKSQAEPKKKLVSTVAQRQVAVAVRTKPTIQPTPFEPQSQYVKEVVEVAPKLSSIKSRFEGLNQKEQRKYGHPPEIAINFGEGSFEEVEEDYSESADGIENDHEEEQVRHSQNDDAPEKNDDAPDNISVLDEKQKPMSEIFSLFGGKATYQEKEKAMFELSRRSQPVVVEKNVMTSEAATETATELRHHPEVPNSSDLENYSFEKRETEHLDESRFMSMRVVKSVRDYIRERDPVPNFEPPVVIRPNKKKEQEILEKKEVAVQTAVVRKHEPEKKQPEEKPKVEKEFTVAEKKKLFESSNRLRARVPPPPEKITREQQTDHLPPEEAFNANELVSGKKQKDLAEQIEEATQEISDYLSYLTPVSQRRSRFENNF